MSDLDVRINGAGTRFTLLAPAEFVEEGITVPAGYRCDFASVPKFLWFWLPPLGRYQRAALLHDWLYGHKGQVLVIIERTRTSVTELRRDHTRAECDAVFLRQMRRDGVGWRTRWTMYLAVRAFGWLYWR